MENATEVTIRKGYVKCRTCKQRDTPAPGTLSKDGKTCLCGDCERAQRYEKDQRLLDPEPDPTYFGVTDSPFLAIPSELEKERPFKFYAKDLLKEWQRAYTEHFMRAEGMSKEEAARAAQGEIKPWLGKLNQCEAEFRRRVDGVVRKRLPEEWRECLSLGTMPLPEIPRQEAADRSASTRETRRAIALIGQRVRDRVAHRNQRIALREVLGSPEFEGVCSRSEIDLLMIWLSAQPQEWRTGISRYDWITVTHQTWCCGRLGRSEIEALLDDEDPGSILNRILARLRALRKSRSISPELAEAITGLLSGDEPELTDVSEINPRVFSATENEDGEVFPKTVYARPLFCSQQSITHRNIEAAYCDDSPSAVYQRSRIERFRNPDPKAPPVAPRYGIGLAKVAVKCLQKFTSHPKPIPKPIEFLRSVFAYHRTQGTGPNRALVLQDRLRAPETLTLSYSQSGRGYNQGLVGGTEINKATRAMREQALKGKKYVRIDNYKNLRPKDERAPWRREEDDLSENTG